MTGLLHGISRRFAWARWVVPLGLRQHVFAFAYRGTREVAYALRLAAVLERRNRNEAALEVYREACRQLERRASTSRHQRHQYEAHHGLHRLGVAEVVDPLFDVCVRDGPALGRRQRARRAGTFMAKVSYLGLHVSGSVDRVVSTAERPKAVEVLVNGVPIRALGLSWKGTAAPFDLTVRRPALATFPVQSELAVRVVAPDGAPGAALHTGRAAHALLDVPHGDATVIERAGSGPVIDKKGRLRLSADALSAQQDAYLSLYERAAAAFEELFERPLFLLYGTLLGRHRDGDFIPGDDDFDVGYVSHEQDPTAVKAEAIGIIRRLVEAGFEISVNRRGKPFRLRAPDGPVDLHLDARPVWYQRSRVWAHKQAALDLPLEVFDRVERVPFRRVQVAIPAGTEAFLRAYYGDAWRVPDPSFSNESVTVPEAVKRNLSKVCLSIGEIEALESDLAALGGDGHFFSIATHDLYPLEVYERRIGW